MQELNLKPHDILLQLNVVGRWAIKQVHGVETLYSTNVGSSLKFSVQQTTFLKIDCFNNGSPFGNVQELGIRIDHHDWYRYQVTQPIEITLTKHLHQVEIMFVGNTDLDEVWTDNEGLAIKIISLSPSAIIEPTTAPHSITVIGDSISAGLWVNGKEPSSDNAPHLNYVGVMSDSLNADVIYNAYSAAGLYRHGTGGVPTADKYLDMIDSETTWQPLISDLILINIGTNDATISPYEFKKLLVNFNLKIQSIYAKTRIVYLTPFNGQFNQIFHETFDCTTTDLIDTSNWEIAYTDRVHPNLMGSRIAGENLAKIIETKYF